MTGERVEVFPRDDGRWAWRRVAENGQVIATDGGQGYEREAEAVRMAAEVNPGLPVIAPGNVSEGF